MYVSEGVPAADASIDIEQRVLQTALETDTVMHNAQLSETFTVSSHSHAGHKPSQTLMAFSIGGILTKTCGEIPIFTILGP